MGQPALGVKKGMARTETSFVVRTTRDALKSHSPSRPPAPCPEGLAKSSMSLAEALTQRWDGLSKSREERHDLIDQRCSISTVRNAYLVSDPLDHDADRVVDISLTVQSRCLADQFDAVGSSARQLSPHQPRVASQLLYGLLEVWLKVTNVELPQLVVVSHTPAATMAHSRPHNL
jgi:hypothetical protein